jgi:hypothetical protein
MTAGVCGVNDATPLSSGEVQFTITVNPLNDHCPVADSQTVTTLEVTPVSIVLTASDIDNDSDCGAAPLSFWMMLPQYGELRGVPPNMTYIPDPGFCGVDSFLFLVEDTQCWGVGEVTINVVAANECPIAHDQSTSTCEDTAVAITLTAEDPDLGTCAPIVQGYNVLTQPANGTLSGDAPNLTYTPATGFSGTDSFTFTATDGECESAPATVSITVNPSSQPPTCEIVVGPRLQITPDVTENMVLACDNLSAEVVLDASLASDPEGASLTYVWLVDGVPVGTDPIVTVSLELGTHDVTLVVDDGGTGECATGDSSSTCSTLVTVIDGCEAVEEIVLLVEQADIGSSLQKTLVKQLKEACKKFAKGKCKDGVKELEAFQDKVAHYDPANAKPTKKKVSEKKRIDHETAVMLIDAAQEVIDAYELDCGCDR